MFSMRLVGVYETGFVFGNPQSGRVDNPTSSSDIPEKSGLSMPEFATVTKSWSSFKRSLQRETYVPLTASVLSKRYVVVRASLWDDRFDSGKVYLPVKLTRLDRIIGHILQLIRDTGATVVGERNDGPVVILEPGNHFKTFTMMSLGIDDEAIYDEAMAASTLGRRIRREERVLRKKLKVMTAEHEAEVTELEVELNATERARSLLSREPAQQQLLAERRAREAAEAEARHLRVQRLTSE